MGYIGAGITRFNTADELTVTGDAQIDTTTLVVDSTNNRVGIGTASPTTALDVTGAGTFVNLISSSNAAYMRFQNSAATGGYVGYVDDDLSLWGNASYKGFLLDGATNDISFYDSTGTTQGLFWDANEVRLGLGTTSPARNLHLYAENSDASVRFQNTANSKVWEINPSIPGVANSGISIVNVTDSTVPLHIDNSGNVGIADASPQDTLHVGGTGTTGIKIGTQGSTGRARIFVDSGNDYALTVDTQNVSDALVINRTSGNVGIGTDSPGSYDVSANNLVIYEAGNAGITIAGGTSNNGSIYFADGTAGTTPYRGIIQYNHSSDYMRFSTAATEAARIDSSQNLLVGKTSADNTTSGTTFYGVEGFSSVRISNPVAILNRLTSDGDIVQFRKDGTTVGSIGAAGGNVVVNSASNYGILQNAGSNQYVWSSSAGAGAFYPETDNSKDLGISSKRFQDLYLSGGAYLGGTGSANHLDDYEFGTWTANINFGSNTGSSTGATYTNTAGNYVKIGNLVHVQCRISLTAKGSSTGNANITGIPFTSNGGGTPIVPMSCWYSAFTGVTRGQVVIGRIDNNSSGIELRFLDGNTEAVLNHTHLTNTSNVAISGTYYTTQ